MTEEMSPEILKEKEIHPEVPNVPWETLILLQRHSRYDSSVPRDLKNITDREREICGHLTEQGIKETEEITRERLEKILAENPEETDFLIVSSPTFWYNLPELGQRAIETSEVIVKTIIDELKKRGLSKEQLLNLSGKFKGDFARPEQRLQETQLFQVPPFEKFMLKKYGGMGGDFWDAYSADVDREKRKELGAEGSVDIANRVNRVMTIVARFAKMYHETHPDRKIVVWMVSHGEDLEPFIQRNYGVKPDEFIANYNEAVSISVDDEGNGILHVRDKDFDANLPNKGFPKPLED